MFSAFHLARLSIKKMDSDFLGFNLVFSLHPGSIDEIEQQDADQTESQNGQVRAEVPKIRNHHVADFGKFFYLREYLLVRQAKNYRTGKEAQHARD
jgi:hypothetical protein